MNGADSQAVGDLPLRAEKYTDTLSPFPFYGEPLVCWGEDERRSFAFRHIPAEPRTPP